MQFWYSVNTHKPATSGDYLIYSEVTGFTSVASVDHFMDGTFRFHNEEVAAGYIDNVTHFASIPPVHVGEKTQEYEEKNQ